MKLEKIIESVRQYADHAVVISEAEPVAPPGPRVVYVNETFTKMTGYAADEILGETPRVLQGLNTDPDARHRIRSNLERWIPSRERMLNYRKDGSQFWVELSIVPVADSTGWWHYWVSVQREVAGPWLDDLKEPAGPMPAIC